MNVDMWPTMSLAIQPKKTFLQSVKKKKAKNKYNSVDAHILRF